MRINPEVNRVFKMESDIRKPFINSASKGNMWLIIKSLCKVRYSLFCSINNKLKA